MSLTVKSEVQGTTLILHIQGIMDYSTLEEFEDLTQLPEGTESVLVDFSEMEFIDSTGIGSIISLIHKATEKGGDVRFENLNEAVRDVFETVGLFRILDALGKGG